MINSDCYLKLDTKPRRHKGKLKSKSWWLCVLVSLVQLVNYSLFFCIYVPFKKVTYASNFFIQ